LYNSIISLEVGVATISLKITSPAAGKSNVEVDSVEVVESVVPVVPVVDVVPVVPVVPGLDVVDVPGSVVVVVDPAVELVFPVVDWGGVYSGSSLLQYTNNIAKTIAVLIAVRNNVDRIWFIR